MARRRSVPAVRRPVTTNGNGNPPAPSLPESQTPQVDRQRLFQEISSNTWRFGFSQERLLNPDELIGRKGMRVYRQMLADDQVKAALALKKHAILSTGWDIEPASDSSQDAEVAEFCTHVFTKMDGTLDDDLMECLSALQFGFCLHGDTIIHSPEGDRPIKDLVGRRPWVYGWDGANLRLARAKKVWKSKKNTLCVKVTYEWWAGVGGLKTDSIICTDNHRFMLLDGSYLPAKNLRAGDRLMPFAQKFSSIKARRNHKVVSIEPWGVADVYDMEVPGYNNFAANHLIVHNSVTELCYRPLVSGQFAGKIGLRALKTRKPDEFVFLVDAHDNLLENGIEQFGKKMPTWKFVIYCLHGETKINTLEGDIPIQDLVGKRPWVFGWKDGALQLGRARKVWQSGKQAPCVKVTYRWYTFRKGWKTESIICTADHRFLKLDGTYERAGSLQQGARLQPFNQKIDKKSGRWSIQTENAPWPHKMRTRARWIWEQVHGIAVPDGYDVHHIDSTKTCDLPENLIALPDAEHSRLTSKEYWKSASKEERQKRQQQLSKGCKEFWKDPVRSANTKRRMKTKARLRDQGSVNRIRAAAGEYAWMKSFKKRWWETIDRRKMSAVMSRAYTPERREARAEEKRAWWKTRKAQGFVPLRDEKGQFAKLQNHEVVSVEPWGFADVYDMEVPDLHNFAANGVIVHNSAGKEFDNHYGTSDLRAAYRCYSDDTRVLTRAGWKYFQDVKMVDELATLNPVSGQMKYQKPSKLYHYWHQGKMFHQGGRFVDMLVTPNHQMWVADRLASPYTFGFKEAKDLPQRVRYKRDAGWVGQEQEWFELPAITVRQRQSNQTGGDFGMRESVRPRKHILMDAWLRFFGIWLAEGCTTHARQAVVSVCQKEGPKARIIAGWIRSIGFSVGEYTDQTGKTVFTITDKQLYEYLLQFGKSHDKFIPRGLLELSGRQLHILYDAMMLGGGSGKSYATVSDQLADDVSEVILKTGGAPIKMRDVSKNRFGPTGAVWIVSRNERNIGGTICNEHTDNRSWVEYTGDVWCAEVPPHHLLYVQRNGKSCWSGNSWWVKDFALKAQSIFLDRYSVPLALGTYPAGNTALDAQIVAFRSALEHLQVATTMTMPSDFTVDFPTVAAQGSQIFNTSIDRQDIAIARAILVPNLLGVSPQGDVGSYSQARKQFDVFILVIEKLQRDLAETVMGEQVIRRLVDLNYRVEEYPKFAFLPFTETDKSQLLSLWYQAVAAGAVTSRPEDEAHVRTVTGFPDVPLEELQAEAEAAKAQPLPGETSPELEPPAEPEDAVPGKEEEEPSEKQDLSDEELDSLIDDVLGKEKVNA